MKLVDRILFTYTYYFQLLALTWVRIVMGFCRTSFTCNIGKWKYIPFVVITIRFVPLINESSPGLYQVRRLVSLVQQELIALLEYLSSLLVSCGVRVAQLLVFCVGFHRSLFAFFFWPKNCLSFFSFAFAIFKLLLKYRRKILNIINAYTLTWCILMRIKFLIWFQYYMCSNYK